jgi:SAM-dependent methyltransferase
MFQATKSTKYYTGCNESLLHGVPATARRILEVGCGEGNLGARLKNAHPERTVFGIEREPAIASRASKQLDEVFTLDVQAEDPPIESGTIDCIVYGDVLEHLLAPDEILTRYRKFLSPEGTILCSIPNVQHHSLLEALLKGDFQYTSEGLLDATHLRFFTYSTIVKLLLDCGFAPSLVDVIRVPCPQAFLEALDPLRAYLGLDRARTQQCLSAYQYIVQGTPVPYLGSAQVNECVPESTPPGTDEKPLSLVVCVSNEATFRANLLSSPCLADGSPHEVLPIRGCRSAAEGLCQGLARARHPLVVWAHQDVYLPRGWPARFWHQYHLAQKIYGKIGVAGVYGVAGRNGALTRAGFVMDRNRLLKEKEPLPASVDTLDELLLAIPKGVPLNFDPRLGFHFYGADICLAAQEQGLAVVALDALCFHNSPHTGLPPDFFQSGQAFSAKWARLLPLATPCVRIDGHGSIQVA